MSGWRWADSVSEGWATLWRGRWSTALMLVFVTGSFVASGALDVHEVASAALREKAWVEAGGRILVVTNDEADGVSARVCDALNSVDGVAAAGAISQTRTRVATSVMPGGATREYVATPGLVGLLGSNVPADALIMASAHTAMMLGVPGGGEAWLTESTVSQGAVDASETSRAARVPEGVHAIVDVGDATDRLGEEYGSGLIVQTSAEGTFDRCFVEAEPGSTGSLTRTLPGMFIDPLGRGAVIVAPRLPSTQFTVSFSDEFQRRATAWLPWFFGGFLGLLALVHRWFRRADHGLYALMGAGAVERVLMATASTFGTLAVGVGVGALGIALAGFFDPAHPSPKVIWTFGARAVGMVAVMNAVATLLIALIPVRSPLADLRDR